MECLTGLAAAVLDLFWWLLDQILPGSDAGDLVWVSQASKNNVFGPKNHEYVPSPLWGPANIENWSFVHAKVVSVSFLTSKPRLLVIIL